MLNKIKKISEEIIDENPWWKYMHDRLVYANGKYGDYYYGLTNGMSMVVPILSDGRLVLVMQYRYLESKNSIEFPGGGIRQGSSPVKTAASELQEETGYIASDFIKVGEFQASNGLFKDKSHIFLAKVENQTEIESDDEEEIEVICRYPEEVDRMVINNDIWCGQTMAAWSITRHYFLSK
ncbi:MAG: NUDIX domain-containing protein [Candidatus Magasanikbacteria bacterium]|nr:NUDIX domain-containing protein [Candidatus Magasanikbacteria bacterium]